MSGLNPNFVLAGVVAVLALAGGAVVAIFLAGGTETAQLARAGLIVAMVAPTVTGLMALLAGNRAHQQATGLAKRLNGHAAVIGEQQAQLTALEQRTAALPDPPAGGPLIGGR